MSVTDKMSFDDYWSNPLFRDKRPVRNGSRKMMVGDNIYYHDSQTGTWQQADSHHSNLDGTPNLDNVIHDTRVDCVLISTHFVYFGRRAPIVPNAVLEEMGYTNVRFYRVFDLDHCERLIEWLDAESGGFLNQVIADPYDFEHSERRYSTRDDKIT